MHKRLLIFIDTFDAKHDLLGFFTSWVDALLHELPQIILVAQHVGSYTSRPNLRVISLDKDARPAAWGRAFEFKKILYRERKNYDAVLVMMAPAWAIVASSITLIFQKKLYLWYAVWKGSWKLRFAELLVDRLLCSVPEAFPFHSRKLIPIGQGIDTDYFVPDTAKRESDLILFLGRLSPVKRIEVLFRAFAKTSTYRLAMVGGAARPSDEGYIAMLHQLADQLGIAHRIVWYGRVSHAQTLPFYQRASLFANLTPRGSFDKSMLEAMACGTITLASNRALERFLPDPLRSLSMFAEYEHEDLASHLEALGRLSEEEMSRLRQQSRDAIIKNHSQKQWIQNFIRIIDR